MEQLYPYAVGRIRAIENNLLTNQELNHMAEEKAIEKIYATLQEHGYAIEEVENKQSFGNMLEKESQKLYQFMQELAQNETFIDLFLCKNDYHNSKTILKGMFIKKPYEQYLSNGGRIDKEELIEIIENKRYEALTPQMEQAIKEAVFQVEKTQQVQKIDRILDKANFEEMMQIAKSSKNEFLIQYVTMLCDLTNIRMFLRVIEQGYKKELFEDAYLTVGTISLELFQQAFTSEEPLTILEQTDYTELVKKIQLQKQALGKLCDNAMMEYVQVAKYKALTIEPLVAYVHAKETEIKNIRILLTGKINQIEPQNIKERLRDSYV